MKEFPTSNGILKTTRLRWVTPKEEKQMVKAMSSDKRNHTYFMFLMDTAFAKARKKLTKVTYGMMKSLDYVHSCA